MMSTKRGAEGDEVSAQRKHRVVDTPSRVLHVRGLPPGCGEQELATVLSVMGQIKQILLLHGKNQAFVEMQDMVAASAIINYYSTPTLRGQVIRIQYSAHQELNIARRETHQPMDPSLSAQSRVLLVQVVNMVYPVTLDVLHQIFSRHGQVLRIITFNKKGLFQAFVEMATPDQAAACRVNLDQQNIYTGCCTLHVEYSKMSELHVKANNEGSRDYTRNDPPSMTPRQPAYGGQQQPYMGGAMGSQTGMGYQHPHQGHMPPMQGNPGMGFGQETGGLIVLVSNLPMEPTQLTCDNLFILFGVYGDVMRVKILYKKQNTALIQYRHPHQAMAAMANLNGVTFRGSTMRVQMSKHLEISVPHHDDTREESKLTKDYSQSRLHRFRVRNSKNERNVFGPCQCLHLSNIASNLEETNIRELFGAYGTVKNFRFFPNNPKMALIEFDALDGAISALLGLHNNEDFGQRLAISFAKGPFKPLPPSNPEADVSAAVGAVEPQTVNPVNPVDPAASAQDEPLE